MDAEATAAEHAEQRVSLKGFSLPDVLKEYKILRQVIFDCLEEKIELSQRDRNVILDFIQTGTVEVASEFCRLTQEEMEDSHAALIEARAQFVASLAHDLKTPLSSARLMAQFLKRHSNDPLHNDAIAMTLRNIDRVDKMVENFLDVNQIIANRPLPAAVEDCNLTELLKALEVELNVAYGKRFILHLPKEDVVGRWNSSQIIRCLENLCNNAVKYGDPGTPITISLSLVDECARVSVHNVGEKIPDSDRATLFVPYQRSPSASRSGKKGWGLGLTLVKGVAESYGGHVDVESDDRGTTFWIYLPIKPVGAEAP